MILHHNLRVVQRPLNRPKNIADKILETIFALKNGAIENCDYGNQLILNEYCNVRIGKAIPGRLQHGWAGDGKFHSDYTNDILSTFLWSENSLRKAKQAGFTNFHAIGAPWLYMMKNIERQGWLSLFQVTNSNRNIGELWVYGRHSTVKFDKMETGLENFINLFNSSQESSKLLLLSHADFTKAQRIGSLDSRRVLTLGKRNCDASSLAHLYRLAHLLSQVKLVNTDYPTSLVFYAIFMGCDVKWIKNHNFELGRELLQNSESNMLQFMDRDILTPQNFREYALQELGYNNMRSPEELRLLFDWRDNRLQSLTPREFLRNLISILTFIRKKLTLIVLKRALND